MRPVRATVLGLGSLALLLLVWLVPPGSRQGGNTPAALAQSGPASPPAVSSPQAPQLAAARTQHSATLLGDGTVLIAGGRSQPGGPPLDSAELFVPTQDAALAAPLAQARAGHAAASSATGEVLLGGGEDAQGRLSSLELFHPSQGVSTSLSLALSAPRSHHTLTTLSDGRQFVVGGFNGANLPLGTALLMDPKLQTVTPSRATLATARARHSATLLSDGRVAVIGGAGPGGTPLASIEIYDPAQDAFLPSPVALAAPRAGHASVLLPDGRILVIGGQGSPAGGVAGRSDSELVDVTRATVTAGPALSGPRGGHSATLLPDGRTLVAGGSDGARALATVEMLALLAPDQRAPRVLHVSPGDGATDVPLDAVVAIRFSEPVRVTTVTAATVVLSGPGGRVEGSVATAESGLLAFFTPRAPLAPDTTYTLALAGLTDTAGNPLPAFSSSFSTVRAAGEPPTITAFSPTAGSEGDTVTITGKNFIGVSGVRFGGIAATTFTAVSTTQINAVVPAGALTGPLSVATPGGTAQSQGYFVVLQRPDFALAAAPDRGETVQGDSVAFAVNVIPSGGFTGLVRLSVSGLPSQLTATLVSLAPTNGWLDTFNALMIVVGTLGALLAFRFASGFQSQPLSAYAAVAYWWGRIGRGFIFIALGALFASAFIARVSVLISQIYFLAQVPRALSALLGMGN